MEQRNEQGKLPIRALGGMNQRISPIDLKSNEFVEISGYYPKQVGLLSRIPGKRFLFDLNGEKIISICPTYNSAGHILIQTETKYWITTADEIFDRTDSFTVDLTAIDFSTEEDMSLAIIVGLKAANTNGDNESASYTIRPLTNEISDPDAITSITANQFRLAAGTYRIRSRCCHYGGAGTPNFARFVHKLYNATAGADLFTGSNFKESTPCISDTITNGWSYLSNVVVLSGTSDIEVQSKVSSTSSSGGSVPTHGKAGNLGANEIYTIVEILKIV